MNTDRRILFALLPALGLAGCATAPMQNEPDAAPFGEANRQTYAAMVVDPKPEYETEMETSAQHASDAVDRYREDKVNEPDTIRSTQTPER